MRYLISLAGVFIIAAAQAAAAQGDAARGAQAFSQCAICHSLEAGQNRVGPSLNGLFGRKAGMVPGFDYSAAMRTAAVVWNRDTLGKYLADPNKFIPGTKMAFPGIKDPSRLSDLLSYLETATH
jgi:cytochrome c